MLVGLLSKRKRKHVYTRSWKLEGVPLNFNAVPVKRSVLWKRGIN